MTYLAHWCTSVIACQYDCHNDIFDILRKTLDDALHHRIGYSFVVSKLDFQNKIILYSVPKYCDDTFIVVQEKYKTFSHSL